LQEAYKFPGYREGDFPVAERVCKEILALPMRDVTEDDVVRITTIIKEVIQ
jgi:UDP-2-acetamido-2-deoxy-ribo-hexuluronate aminotransferase